MAENLTEILDQVRVWPPCRPCCPFMGYKPQEKRPHQQGRHHSPLVVFLTEPARVVKAYAALSPAEREVIVALQRQGGEATRGAIRRRLRDRGLLDPHETKLDTYSNQQPDFRRTDSRFLDEILAHLLACRPGLWAPHPR